MTPVRKTSHLLPNHARHKKGFALIITISMMILLALLSVGLLSLSRLALSGSSRGSAMAEARTNARLALELAIAQIQKQTGPDQRVTVNADIRTTDTTGEATAAAEGRRHWTGVYDSWTDSSQSRPDPSFRTWLVSGDPDDLDDPSVAEQAGSGNEIVELVGEGTVGNDATKFVSAPAMTIENDNGTTPRIAWWSGDQSTKAALSTPSNPEDASFAAVRQDLQATPRSAVELAESAANQKPFDGIDPKDARISLVSDWKQSGFLASDVTAPGPLFHDLAAHSSGLMTNVRLGGFRKDLSMALERPLNRAPDEPLYTVNGEPGINFSELWGYYNLYTEVKERGRGNFTTGGTVDPRSPHMSVAINADAAQRDDFFHYKQPVIISYQLVLSLETRPQSVNGNTVNRLRIVADPIITLWNPLDVPLVVPRSAFMSVKYWSVPYDLLISVNGQRALDCPIIASLSPSDSNYLSLQFGQLEQLTFKPGEVIKVSQSGNTIVKGSTVTDHNLAGRSGFNYGGGVSLPVRTRDMKYIDLQNNDTITYQARPNNLTAGKSGSAGNVLPGYLEHTRHFSLTHHEVYVGTDRGSNSLGYGGMYVDWDFGNRRLRPGEVRAERQAGTKPAGERLYANRLPDVFPQIRSADTRPLTSAELNGRKSPIMMVSYNAKTENGSDLGTQSLARFNPRAYHVDFYDLSQQERDMLPYEFSIEPLLSWKNRNLEVSANGNAYFGGGMDAQFGQSFITTHSVPREPPVSLGALQHSFANGFEIQRPVYGYAALNAREPMQPQISHAIGNSMAPSMIESDRTEATTSGSRPLADHSYLANKALWDDWFFSSIAPQTQSWFARSRRQRDVAEEFLNNETPLPIARYKPSTGGEDIDELLSEMFRGSTPSEEATAFVASLIRISGAFNVNSTSIEAWKAMLGGLKGQPIIVRDQSGSESLEDSNGETPVVNLNAPTSDVSDGSGNVDVTEPEQWVGRRSLDEDDIDNLARAIVMEVRKRGPFLNLGDFVNRRLGQPGDEKSRSGAIQSALDSDTAGLNEAFLSGSRAVSQSVASRFAFPEAEEGPVSYGIPGFIKQADILTPIAPVLTVRSDSFIVRAYGESVDSSGKVLARAWCEAVVERDRNYIDSSEEPEKLTDSLTEEANRTFGRRYQMVSFRWLSPEEV